MKYLITAMMLLTVSFAKAQIVNIPDSNFKKIIMEAQYEVSNNVYNYIDNNRDGELQQSEAEAITGYLDLSHHWFGSVDTTVVRDFTGIKTFVNMKTFAMASNASGTLDLSGLNNLVSIIVGADYMGVTTHDSLSVLINGCVGLKQIQLQGGVFAAIDFSSCVNLENLSFSNAHLPSFQLGNLRKLKYFTYSQPNRFSSSMNLVDTLNHLDFTHCDSLSTLQLGGVYIQTLDISGLTKLQTTMLSTTKGFEVGAFIARNCLGISELVMPSLWSVKDLIDLTGCTNLTTLDIGYSGVSSLDLSTCYNLRSFSYSGSQHNKLQNLNLKNGSMLSSFNFDLFGYSLTGFIPISVCADEFEIDVLRNYFRTTSSVYLTDDIRRNVNISSYCTFFPGGNYNTIQGKIRLDANNNGCDSTDRGMPNVALRITDTSGNSLIRYSAPLGDFAYYPYKGLFTLTPYFPYPYFTVNPSVTNVRFDTANSLLNTSNFCIQPNGVHNDLEITFLPSWPQARPGFNAAYTLVYKNRGTTTLSGNVQVNFDNSKMNFTSASTNTTAQSTGQLTWNYNNLQPFESRTIDVTFNLLPPPINNINDTITYLASITPNSNDETPFDNSFILPQRVRGSFDPNEKQCLEGSQIDISKIGDYLHYQIHFQNEGTDTAFNVVVTDTLSSKLDWNSFELINSSHPVSISNKSGKLEFIFENIKLPYKAINEPASNGYVAFKIKPTNTDVVGDSLNNKAAIYFDFNLPVVTNTATTIITSLSPVPVKLEYFSITHKASSNELNWKATCTFGNAKFEIERSDDGIHFTDIGNITASTIRCQLPLSFTDNHPTAGKNYYRLKITDADGISFYSKTLVVGNNKAGFEITAISNSNIYFNSSKQQTIQLKLLAADGKLIYADSKTITAGSNQINLPIKNAATGIYTLVVYTNDGEVVTKKFIK